MNTGTIQISTPPQISWTTVNAQDKEADFLSLRLLNKRTRVRISTRPLDLSVYDGKGNYFVVSNTKGWFIAVARNASGGHQLVSSPLSDLRENIVSSKTEGEDEFAPKRVLSVAGAPVHLALALGDERLVVGFSDGSISVYDSSTLLSPGDGDVQPLRTFPPGSPGPLRQILGNPGDLPELVAIRRDAGSVFDGFVVEILDIKQLQYVGGWRTSGNAETMPTSIAWSAKGKQLAIGLRNGDIVTYSPSDTNSIRLHVPKPPSVGESSAITVLWLSNQAFYGIYSPAGDSSPEATQKHVLTLFDPKTRSVTQTELETPYYPSPGLRPPGAFTVVMRNWNPAKFLVFIGDNTSSDIGLVGSLAENDTAETWCNLSLEETSTPAVPLDKDAEDTVLLALDLDLTSDRGDQAKSPVLYLYASDGTLQAWFVANEKGGSYPVMIAPSSSSASSTSEAMQVTEKSPGIPSAFSQSSTSTSSFGSTGFGSTPAKFGQPASSPFGGTGFGNVDKNTSAQTQAAAPVFGSSSFGQQSPTSAFGQASGFGQSSNTSAFGSSTQSAFGQIPAAGFGAFASTATSKFGSPGFGFGSQPPPAASSTTEPVNSPAVNPASPEAEMSDADDGEANKIAGLSLGGTSASSKSQDQGANSMFGSFGQSTAQEKSSPSPSNNGSSFSGSFGGFGGVQGSGFMKPATGFGAFLKPAESQTTPKESNPDQGSKASPAFGASGFGSMKPATFGQSAFGQSSSFGAASSFGKPSPIASPSAGAVGTSGAFSAFAGASKGFASFAQSGTSGFGQQPQAVQTKLTEAPSISMATSSEGDEKTSISTTTGEQKTPAFGTSQAPFSLGGANPSSSSFASTPGTGQSTPKGTETHKPSSFSTPTARAQSPTSSPEGTPALGRKPKPDVLKEDDIADDSFLSPSMQSTTPFGTPAPSIFKTAGPVPSGGAFGNLTSTPSALRPAEGFGAFNASTSSTSPFSNPKAVVNSAFNTPAKPVSAFGAGGSGPTSAFQTSTASSTTPKFGLPSTPTAASVFGKSSFGTPATPSPASTTPLATPTGNAFGAYSGSGGFNAFAKVGKPSSFSDLLKSQKDENTIPPQTPVTSKEKEKDERSFVTVPTPEELDQDNLPPTPSTHGTFDEEDQNLGDEEEEEEEGAESFISESFSEGSRDADEEEEEEGEIEEEEEDAEEEEEEEEELEEVGINNAPVEEKPVKVPSSANVQSPASIPLPLTPEPVTQESNDDQSANKKGAPLFAKVGSGIPTLFGKRIVSTESAVADTSKSASPSPPASLFGKQFGPSSDSISKPPSQSVSEKPVPSVQSTTPPGTPNKLEGGETVLAPKPVTPAQTTLDIGRPSSRPTRTSPLSGTPVPGEESNVSSGNQTAQPLLRPRPASPRLPFGQIPTPPVGQQKSLFPSVPKPAQSTSPISTGLVGTVPKPAQPLAAAQGTSTTPPTFKSPTLGTALALSATPGSAPFIMPSSGSAAQCNRTGISATHVTAFKPPGAVVQQAQPPAQTPIESGMQRECQTLYMTVVEELGQLGTMSQTATAMRTMMGKPSPWIHSKQDLGNKMKWTFGDLVAFERLIKGLEKDVASAYALKNEFVPLIREIESNLLKAETRKEEILRFSKAKADPEFARMLRARTLGPDAAETQGQLRKQIRFINDRVEQLEAHLRSCKKRIQDHRRGKGSMKPPTLDTVNRTYRNIDLAIESQTQQIEALTARVAKLNVNALDTALHGPLSSARRRPNRREALLSADNDDGEGSESGFRPQVTPSIAASTAAALNAERSALRLKNALANTRNSPLLNTQAAEPAKRVPTLNHLSSGGNFSIEFPSDPSLPLDSSQERDPDKPGDSQRRPGRHFAHGKSAKLGKTPTQLPPSIATFDWGPLPKAKPMTTLPWDLRPVGSSKE